MQKEILSWNKEELKHKVQERLNLGQEFIDRIITTEQQKNEWWSFFMDWDSYNEELIKQAFDMPNNSYTEDYKRKYRPEPYAVSFSTRSNLGTPIKNPTFQESIERKRNQMRGQVKKLKQFYDKIDLFKTESYQKDEANNDINSILDKIDNLEYSDAFEILDDIVSDKTTYKALKNEFILGKTDIHYTNRLKVFVKTQIS